MSELLQDRVRVDMSGPVGVVTLARPDAGNALDLPMAEALAETGERLAAQPAMRAVLLAAEGRAFCVGGDLREFAAAGDVTAHVDRVAGAVHAFLEALHRLGRPVVSAVQGVAAGGGIGLALAGDLVVCGRSARFLGAYTNAGLSPDCGVSWRLARALGPALAADLLLTNRSFTAEDAARWGLVSRVVEDADLLPHAVGLAGSLAAGSPPALGETLRLLAAAADRGLEEHLVDEAATIARLADSPNGREGVAAFLGKRRPSFPA